MRITSISRNKKNNTRLSAYIDDQYAFSISEEDYLRLNLYAEREITEEEIDYIKNSINFGSAKSTAVKYLALRLRTEREVYTRLENDGYSCEIINNVIQELKSLGYINDKIYAQKYLSDRSKLKPKSKKLLKLELQNKGISGILIDELLNECEIDEAGVAEALARKKFGKYDLTNEKVIQKLQMFLRNRGFSFETIESVIKKMTVTE